MTITPVDAESEDPTLKAIFGRFAHGEREVPLLYRILGNAPSMLDAWTAMAWPLRFDAKSDRGLRELLIMRVALLSASGFEWQAHWPAAVKYGVTHEQLTSLRNWESSLYFSAEEQIALRCTDEIVQDGGASEDCVRELNRHFDSGSCIEIILTAAFYTCVSRTLKSLSIDPDPSDPSLQVFHQQLDNNIG
ncbi:MAG: hypothetical protein CL759_10935 [Chloroflexi bacterium]|nr:hypothetical protein [Chloroflexota bacterium]|tara:strand:+ start:15620 stop:16192 length:573 start_codon:yes stop_codon:yes gene_type:complete